MGQSKPACWWCGAIANSREHKYKKSDLKRVFKAASGFDAVIVRGDKDFTIQGPDSRLAKYEMNICHACNTTKSQPFDLAYDKFIIYVEANAGEIIKSAQIDCAAIFGANAAVEKLNLLRYYVKSFCCRLAANKISIDDSIIQFLDGKPELQCLLIKFEIRLDLMQWLEIQKRKNGDIGNLYMGALSLFPDNESHDYFNMVYSFYTYRWFKTMFFYSPDINDADYPRYRPYNNSIIIPVKALYNVHPVDFAGCTEQEFLDEFSKRKEYTIAQLVEDTFSSNPMR